MDTLLFCKNFEYKCDYKLIVHLVNVSIIGVLVLSQMLFPISANDMKLAQTSVPIQDKNSSQIKEKILNEISPETRQKNFDLMIKQKFPKAIVNDVTDGVKHIKLTKYYSGRPVRINVVEVDFNLAKDLELTPALSSSQNLKSRRTITTIAKNNNAIVFFKL